MFDFTKEVVINSTDQFEVVSGKENGMPAKLRVHGGGEYFGKYVVEGRSYKTPSVPGREFTLEFAPVTVAEGDVQYCIELGLDRGDARGDWGSAMYYFKKPLLVTVSKDATADDIAAAFRKVGSGYGMIVVPEHKGASKVTIMGGDDKIKVRGIKVYNLIEKDDQVIEIPFVDDKKKDAGYSGATYTYTANQVEFGTANYLIHNLRLPTYENYRFTSPAVVEMPIAGTGYTQFTFLYCVPRPGLGGLSVAGQTNNSTTTHVFYVAANIADKFGKALGAIGVSISPIVVPEDTKDLEIIAPGLEKYAWDAPAKEESGSEEGQE